MLRDAGVEVVTGVLEKECREINPVFMTAHTLRRPWVTLKWAQSRDGYIDRIRTAEETPALFSTPVTKALTHRLRSLHDAIMTGSGTVKADNPSLDVRAVSYTHLDVYKRQVINLAMFVARISVELLRSVSSSGIVKSRRSHSRPA